MVKLVATISPQHTVCGGTEGVSSVPATYAPLYVSMDCIYLPTLICCKGKDIFWGLERKFSFCRQQCCVGRFFHHIDRQAEGREMIFCLR